MSRNLQAAICKTYFTSGGTHFTLRDPRYFIIPFRFENPQKREKKQDINNFGDDQ